MSWVASVDQEMLKRALDVIGLNEEPLNFDNLHPALRNILNNEQAEREIGILLDDDDVYDDDVREFAARSAATRCCISCEVEE